MGLISNDKVEERLNNPNNLMNRLRLGNTDNKKNNAMNLFGVGVRALSNPIKIETAQVIKSDPPEESHEVIATFNPFNHKDNTQLIPSRPNTILPKESKPEPTLEELLPESEAQIKLGHAHDQALSLLTDSVIELKLRLSEIKAEKLPSVISSASKVVESIRRERIEANKKNGGNDVHFHFYTPEQKKTSDYEIIEVG